MTTESLPPAALPIDTRSAFHAALRSAFDEAAGAGCREILLADVDFADWPLGERAVIDSLTRWAYAHRRLTLLATHFDEVPRRHPRFAEWRRNWAHVIDCRANDEVAPGAIPTLWLAPGLLSVRLFDREHWRGRVSRDPADSLHDRERFDELLQRSEAAFPATTLGI